MNKYISEFLNTKNASQLPAYFDALERKKEDSLFLMPKRVLHFYFLAASELDKDRFLKRCHCFEEYIAAPQELERYQTIYLAGDAMSSGYQLFRYYCILKKMAGNHRIVSIVYALSTEFPRDSLLERMYGIYYEVYNVAPADQEGVHQEAAASMWKDFVAHLYCHWYLNQENISLFSLDETRLLQRTVRTVMSTSIVAEYERPAMPVRTWLEALCRDTADWRYVPLDLAGISYDVFDGGPQMGYFECQPAADQKPFLMNSVVFCKYWEDDASSVIFAPVSIGRSYTKDQLLATFCKTVESSFPAQIAERLVRCDLHLMYHLLLDISSLQISCRFQELLQAKGFPTAKFTGGLVDLPLDGAVCVQAAAETDTPTFSQGAPRLPDIFHMVKNEILRQESSGSLPVSMEDIEEFLTTHTQQNPKDINNLLTGVWLLLMETAVCSSTVFIVDDMVKNALMPEENSNCLLSAGERLCHICADVLYIAQGTDQYEAKKGSFLSQMKQELKDMDAFADDRSEKCFSDYSIMLESASREDAPYKILGKRFLVRNLAGLLRDVQMQAIQMVEER